MSIATAAGFDRREAIVIVERMKECQMQDRRHARRRLIETHAAPADAIFIRLRPAVGAGHHLHAIGAQRVEFAHRAVERDRLDIGIAGQQEMRHQHLEECTAVLPRVRPRQQQRERMRLALLRALESFFAERSFLRPAALRPSCAPPILNWMAKTFRTSPDAPLYATYLAPLPASVPGWRFASQPWMSESSFESGTDGAKILSARF